RCPRAPTSRGGGGARPGPRRAEGARGRPPRGPDLRRRLPRRRRRHSPRRGRGASRPRPSPRLRPGRDGEGYREKRMMGRRAGLEAVAAGLLALSLLLAAAPASGDTGAEKARVDTRITTLRGQAANAGRQAGVL